MVSVNRLNRCVLQAFPRVKAVETPYGYTDMYLNTADVQRVFVIDRAKHSRDFAATVALDWAAVAPVREGIVPEMQARAPYVQVGPRDSDSDVIEQVLDMVGNTIIPSLEQCVSGSWLFSWLVDSPDHRVGDLKFPGYDYGQVRLLNIALGAASLGLTGEVSKALTQIEKHQLITADVVDALRKTVPHLLASHS